MTGIYHSKVSTGMTGEMDGDDWNSEHVYDGALASGGWVRIPSVFRLRLTGTGTATMDSRDSLGNIYEELYVFLVEEATDQIEFPYAGDNAIEIRVTLTGTVTAEVI